MITTYPAHPAPMTLELQGQSIKKILQEVLRNQARYGGGQSAYRALWRALDLATTTREMMSLASTTYLLLSRERPLGNDSQRLRHLLAEYERAQKQTRLMHCQSR